MSDIDTADHVFHEPTGETWVVACVQGDKLSWCGWPEGMAELSDCRLIKKATPEERQKLLAALERQRPRGPRRTARRVARAFAI